LVDVGRAEVGGCERVAEVRRETLVPVIRRGDRKAFVRIIVSSEVIGREHGRTDAQEHIAIGIFAVEVRVVEPLRKRGGGTRIAGGEGVGGRHIGLEEIRLDQGATRHVVVGAVVDVAFDRHAAVARAGDGEEIGTDADLRRSVVDRRAVGIGGILRVEILAFRTEGNADLREGSGTVVRQRERHDVMAEAVSVVLATDEHASAVGGGTRHDLGTGAGLETGVIEIGLNPVDDVVRMHGGGNDGDGTHQREAADMAAVFFHDRNE